MYLERSETFLSPYPAWRIACPWNRPGAEEIVTIIFRFIPVYGPYCYSRTDAVVQWIKANCVECLFQKCQLKHQNP